MKKPKTVAGMAFGIEYEAMCNAISCAIADWFETHPGADPRFKFPPDRVVITGDISMGPKVWEPNDDARELVQYVDRVTGHRGSMLQFQVCYQFYQRYGRRPNA